MGGGAYYNEHDPVAAAWLRALIAAGELPPGDVDERDIRDVRPADVAHYTQCHFFAGIGGWPLALRLAGWPDDKPIWTGSCPCQPFSSAGRGGGFDDERHLWPHWYWLIQECAPAILFGEQVASAAGRTWLDLVFDDLEALDYACGAADLCAAGVGAPHIRQRLFWVAHSDIQQFDRSGPRGPGRWVESPDVLAVGGVADRTRVGRGEERPHRGGRAEGDRAQGLSAGLGTGGCDLRPSPLNGHWADADWLLCRDERWRPVESGTFPLAHGLPARVGRLRGYGNAIVPQVAAQFIGAYLEGKP